MSGWTPLEGTVLLVDDSEVACESVKHTLGGAGADVVTLNGPFGFIKATREAKPHVILLDVGLGSVSGTKLVGLGRRHAPPGCRILLYSSRDPASLHQDVIDSGADGYVSKTTVGTALVEAIRPWLSIGHRARPERE